MTLADATCPMHTYHVRCVAHLEFLIPLRGFWLRVVGIIFPMNNNEHVQPKYARSKVQTYIYFHK